MKIRNVVSALALGLALPSLAHADILLKNKDRRSYQLAIRHEVTTTIVDVPANTYMVVTEGARSVQVRDAQGNPKGEPIMVSEGDRLMLQNGQLKKGQRAISEE